MDQKPIQLATLEGFNNHAFSRHGDFKDMSEQIAMSSKIPGIAAPPGESARPGNQDHYFHEAGGLATANPDLHLGREWGEDQGGWASRARAA